MPAEPKKIRLPIVAGRFYPADPDQCRADAVNLCAAPYPPDIKLPTSATGALVPHAGWICSGRIAASLLRCLSERTESQTIILLGAVHTTHLNSPTLDTAHAWQTPLGTAPVNTELRDALAQLPDFTLNDQPHQNEHCLEVQIPFIQTIFPPTTTILPCLIPPTPDAPAWGNAIGNLLKNYHQTTIILGSTDLTHYGPNYNFTPAGLGQPGHQWATQNDQQLIKFITDLDAPKVIVHAGQNHSACGAGAIAATITACQSLNSTTATLLEHTDSSKELAPIGHDDPNNSVGYASLIFN